MQDAFTAALDSFTVAAAGMLVGYIPRIRLQVGPDMVVRVTVVQDTVVP
ncbi:hypothetical protein [Bradyrhizobium sp. MOS002]|nr:hypothetical protein [Bradyrhizobium sp. MOS002]